MRNLTKYPVTYTEAIRELEDILSHDAELAEGKEPVFGNMRPTILAWIIARLKRLEFAGMEP
jgi:hypothetical protein